MTLASRRQFIHSLTALAATPVLPAIAQAPAGAWPQRPIELIVPFAAGGGTDVLARALAEVARKHLPQDLIVLNRAGASGAVGWTELANARPDGYKIGIITVELTMIPHMGLTKISSDAVLPVARLNADPATIAVRADSPYRSIEELIAAARKDEAAVRIGNAGPGSLGHLAAAALQDKAGVKFNHAPYRGANPAVLDLLGGH
ncbi:MAG: tripartite tricarboxylate transporter substrate binding protein, partial [Delftia sp.]|nr:tripartite tricarboxylate transporter substrate binding protein [Delftia sp.]